MFCVNKRAKKKGLKNILLFSKLQAYDSCSGSSEVVVIIDRINKSEQSNLQAFELLMSWAFTLSDFIEHRLEN